jgi:hypothetical protein
MEIGSGQPLEFVWSDEGVQVSPGALPKFEVRHLGVFFPPIEATWVDCLLG